MLLTWHAGHSCNYNRRLTFSLQQAFISGSNFLSDLLFPVPRDTTVVLRTQVSVMCGNFWGKLCFFVLLWLICGQDYRNVLRD